MTDTVSPWIRFDSFFESFSVACWGGKLHLEQSRSSHRVILRPCGIAMSAQLDSCTSEKQQWPGELEKHSYCFNKLVCLQKSLASIAPDAAQY